MFTPGPFWRLSWISRITSSHKRNMSTSTNFCWNSHFTRQGKTGPETVRHVTFRPENFLHLILKFFFQLLRFCTRTYHSVFCSWLVDLRIFSMTFMLAVLYRSLKPLDWLKCWQFLKLMCIFHHLLKVLTFSIKHWSLD